MSTFLSWAQAVVSIACAILIMLMMIMPGGRTRLAALVLLALIGAAMLLGVIR